MNQTLKAKLITAIADQVIAHSGELTLLDQAIGDGDHGVNMKRGFEAVRSEAESLAEKPLPDALKAVGMKLVMKVGGASGPLYGTLFMAFGKNLPADPTLADAVRALSEAIEAVKARGKSDVGQKTMLDVLAPVHAELADIERPLLELIDRVEATADAAAQATVSMRAIRGRAAFLGERSIGHMDPGSRSSALIVAAVCDVFRSDLGGTGG
jgi:phosphoenolpyruvate---glycerone phosphotransferase subunit DhaL